MPRYAHMLRKLVILVILAATFAGNALASGSLGTAAAKQANAKFGSLVTAKAAGYGVLLDAKKIACIAMPGTGAMGIHYAKPALVGDAKIDPLRPEALVYEPQGNRTKLVALEYVVFKAAWDKQHSSPPSLFGRPFGLTLKPNRFGLDAYYSLHAWLYESNPLGTFAPWNPRVSCASSGG